VHSLLAYEIKAKVTVARLARLDEELGDENVHMEGDM